ncbi:calcium-binding protein CML42-like [Punica granatum]|uniref:EF-hand domain-containing protein n=2 Tax=Punica granatum TaxID=22663 RepID=A0A218XA72_PUNGR|nr:calcium-binding protein CML42-like [Punica granatum]OWM81586.1 hypothetical protein CDL15_Pgr007624 [Punica granatum]PKI41002.1 hypothetical protein CRG98_038530 [Punica granatum]
MEVSATTEGSVNDHSSASCGQQLGRGLSRRSAASFRLRSPSLNSLRLRRIFDLFDKNGDGTITVLELSQALSALGLNTELSELKSSIASHIQPGNSGMLFDDFVSLHKWLDDTFFGNSDGFVADENSQDESDLCEAFKVFDEDGDGYISARELQAVLGKLGLSEGNEIASVQRMIVSVDRNRDGRVDFFEFKDMMKGVMAKA